MSDQTSGATRSFQPERQTRVCILSLGAVLGTPAIGLILYEAWETAFSGDAFLFACLMGAISMPAILLGIQALSVKVTVTSEHISYKSWLFNRIMPTSDVEAISLSSAKCVYFLTIKSHSTSITCSTYSFTEAQLNDIQLAIANACHRPPQQLGLRLIQPWTKYDKIAISAMLANFLIVGVTLILISKVHWSFR